MDRNWVANLLTMVSHRWKLEPTKKSHNTSCENVGNRHFEIPCKILLYFRHGSHDCSIEKNRLRFMSNGGKGQVV